MPHALPGAPLPPLHPRLPEVAILCGGPDWPTSVLAGVLGLSVMQCELGTLPIIFFIVPCGLSGSLYLRMDKSDIWARAAQTMIITAMLLNLLLWALAAWAMHRRLEREYDRLRKPLASNVDLEWLDYQAVAAPHERAPTHTRRAAGSRISASLVR